MTVLSISLIEYLLCAQLELKIRELLPILQHLSTLSVDMRSTNQACLHSVFDQKCTSETGERIRMTVVEADSKS